MTSESPTSLPTSFKPAPEQVVIASIFDEEEHIHAVRAPGEEERDGIKLSYLVAERASGIWEVVGERFYTESPLHHASIDGLDKECDWLHYAHNNLPTLAFVTGKTQEELEGSEFAYHQGNLNLNDAAGELKRACFRLLSRYVVWSEDTARGCGFSVRLFLSPFTSASTWVDAVSREEMRSLVDVMFDFTVLDPQPDTLRYGISTPWGLLFITDLVRYDLSDQDLPLDELEEVLHALLTIKYAHEDVVAVLERQELDEWDALREGVEGDEDDADELLEAASSTHYGSHTDEWEAVLAELEQSEQERMVKLAEDSLLARSDEVSPDELIDFLYSEDIWVRTAAVKNPRTPLQALYVYARTGLELETRLEALQEYNRRIQ